VIIDIKQRYQPFSFAVIRA